MEWIAIFFSRDWTQVSRIAGRRFTVWATREAKSYSMFVNINVDILMTLIKIC